MTESKPIEQPTSKNYKWEPTANVSITGLEYSILRNTVDVFRGCPLFLSPAFHAAVQSVDNIFKRMLEESIAIEYEPEETTTIDPSAEKAIHETAVNPS